MPRGFAVVAVTAAVLAVGSAGAQETRPGAGAAGPGMSGQHGHEGHLMMCHHLPAGGAGAPGPRAPGPGMMGPGMMGPGMMRGLADLPADPKQAARVLRFRADMLKAISEVLARHAAELEKGP